MYKFFFTVSFASLLSTNAFAENIQCTAPLSRAPQSYYFANGLRTGYVWRSVPTAGDMQEWADLGEVVITRGTTDYSFRASLTVNNEADFKKQPKECFLVGSTTYAFKVVPDVPVLEDGGSTVPADQYASEVIIVNNLVKNPSRACRKQSEPRPLPYRGKLDCRTQE